MMVRLPTHICITRPQWFTNMKKKIQWINTYFHQQKCTWKYCLPNGSHFIQASVYYMFKSLSGKWKKTWLCTRNLQIKTHSAQVMHISCTCKCIGKLGHLWFRCNGLSPVQHQAIFRTNAGLLLNGPLGTKLSTIWIKYNMFYTRKKVCTCHLQNVSHFVSAQVH